MSDLLFVTSFGPDLYEASGKELIASLDAFHQCRSTVSTTLVCVEGLGAENFPPGTLVHNLDIDPFLQSWLSAHEDHIPVHLGGTMKDCSCPGREKRHAKHKYGCPGQWMNRNASRWFRKVASYRVAATMGFRYLVWLDSDCLLLKEFGVEAVKKILDGHGVAFCKGHRPAVESGVVLFDLKRGGRAMIDGLCDRYVSTRVFADERWDDGFQMARVAKEIPSCNVVDLVHPTKLKGKTNDVIPHTPLAEFVKHAKGKHGTGLELML